jgi:hypothetical protein
MATRRQHFAEHEDILTQIEEGFAALQIAALTITDSIVSDGQEGVTGNYQGTITRIRIKNGIVTGVELA